MEEIISQKSGTNIWDDSAIIISQEDLIIAPIVLEPVEIDFSLTQSNNKYESLRETLPLMAYAFKNTLASLNFPSLKKLLILRLFS